MEERERDDASQYGNGAYALLSDYDFQVSAESMRTGDCFNISLNMTDKEKAIVSIQYS